MNYWKIDTEDICNGEGLRVVLWLSGCNHRCKGCQNPQTWDANSGIPFDEKAKEELFRELNKNYISGLTLSGGDPLNEANLEDVLDIVTEFNKRYKQTLDVMYKHSNSCNMLSENADKSRLSCPNKTIWLYTGYTLEQIMFPIITNDFNLEQDKMLSKRREIVESCDILVDGKYIESQRDSSLKWCGSKNQRVINILESLKQNKVILYCE